MASPTRKKKQVKVDSTDYSSDVQSYAVTEEQKENHIEKKASIVFQNTWTRQDPGKTLEIWEGITTSTEKKIFVGEILSVEENVIGFVVTAMDKMYNLARKDINKHYDSNIDATAGKISDIFIDMVGTQGGFNTEVTDSGTAITLNKFNAYRVSIFDRALKISQILNWITFYDPSTDKFNFKPKNFGSTGVTLSTADNAATTFKWEDDSIGIINHVVIVGKTDNLGIEEFFDGTGSQDTFTLNKQPNTVEVFVDSGSGFVVQTPGVAGITSGTFDYTYDRNNGTVTFESGSIPPSGTDNVKIIYNYRDNILVSSIDEASVTTYGEKKKDFYVFDAITKETATIMADSIISEMSQPSLKTANRIIHIESTLYDLDVGKTIDVVDTFNTANNGTYTITGLKRLWPGVIDEISLSNRRPIDYAKESMISQDRIRRLEEEIIGNEGILVVGKTSSNTLTLSPSGRNFFTRNIGDSFIIGHAENGRIGIFGDNFEESTINDHYWVETESGGTIAVSSTQAAKGLQSARFNQTGSGTSTLKHTLSEVQTTIRIDGQFYDDSTETDAGLIFAVKGEDDSSGDNVQIGINTDTSTTKYSYYNNSSWAASTVDRSTGWHTFKIWVTGGTADLYIDSTQVATGISIAELESMTLLSTSGGNASTFYFDDIRSGNWETGVIPIIGDWREEVIQDVFNMTLTNNGGGTWGKRKKIAFTDTTGSAVTDEALEIALSNFPSADQTAGKDIRVVNEDSDEIDHQIYDDAGTKKVRFKVNCRAYATDAVYVYYGNASATTTTTTVGTTGSTLNVTIGSEEDGTWGVFNTSL